MHIIASYTNWSICRLNKFFQKETCWVDSDDIELENMLSSGLDIRVGIKCTELFNVGVLFWLVGLYGISTLVGYLKPKECYMLRAILNKSWWQHPTRHQLYGHLPPITKTIQVRQTRHAGHCWRSKDKLIRDVLLWTPTHGRAKAGRPARTYIQQLCEDTGCYPEDLPRAMNDREEWWERIRDIRATSAIWWW